MAKEKEKEQAGARRRVRLLHWSCSLSYRNFHHWLARELTGIVRISQVRILCVLANDLHGDSSKGERNM